MLLYCSAFPVYDVQAPNTNIHKIHYNNNLDISALVFDLERTPFMHKLFILINNHHII